MLKSAKILGVMAFVLLVAGVSFAQTSEKLTITTYYPAPYGVYNVLRLMPHSQPVTPCGPNGANAGSMYFDSDDNTLKICDGTNYIPSGWWSATEYQTGHNVWGITNKNTGNVSIDLGTISYPWYFTGAVRAFTVADKLRINANSINLSHSVGNNSAQADFSNGAFNFRSWRKNPDPTHKHPWVNFDSTYPEANWQPAFELYPPVAMEGAQAAGMSCDKLCLQKFKPPIGNLDPLVANGVFCWAATGSNNYTTLEGEGTKITCDATNKKYIHCLCGKLGPVSDPPGGW